MNEDIQRIQLNIGTLKLPVNVRREEETYYREAERIIKERYAHYSAKYPNQKVETYYIMMALDVTVQAQRAKHSVDLEPVASRLESLLGEIEKAL